MSARAGAHALGACARAREPASRGRGVDARECEDMQGSPREDDPAPEPVEAGEAREMRTESEPARDDRDGGERDRGDGGRGDEGRQRERRPEVDHLVSVKLDNLSYDLREDDLRDAFEKFGEIGDVYIPKERGSFRPRGFGFVRFVSQSGAEAAVDAMNETELGGRQVRWGIAGRGGTESSADQGGGNYETGRPDSGGRRGN